MDEPSPQGPADLVPPPDPALLRELKDRAQAALANHREQAAELEQRVADEINRVAEGLAEALDENQAEATEKAAADAEAALADRREAFEAERQEWEQLRDEIEAQLETLREQLGEQAATQQTRDDELAGREQALDTERKQLTRWAADLADERAALESNRLELRMREEQLAGSEPATTNQQQVEELEARLQELKSSSAERIAQLVAQCDELTDQSQHLETQLAEAESGGGAGAEKLAKARSEWDAEREALQAEVGRLKAAASEAEAELAAANERIATTGELGDAARELQEKFELALSDLQQHRERVAELEQELAARPEANQDESAELSQLRAERDQLVQTVGELESRPAVGDGSEEVEDLRRRFELAVEDVRQLKTEKAELEQRLADAAVGGDAAADNDGLDWEAQKRRMLASLEGESVDPTPERAEERATIEGTIRITDQVVAEKDELIARLETQLGAPVVLEPSIGDDERLEEERNRLAELERQWEEKLREAELELSVSRAKIAREQAELQELRTELEQQQRTQPETPAVPGSPDKPQRRWLDKLGLGGGE